MIEIKFAFSTIAEAAAFMAQQVPSAAPLPAIVPPAEPPKETKTPKPPKADTKTETAAAAPPAQAETPAASPPSAAAAPTAAPAVEPMTYEKSGLAVKISQAAAKDKPATVALLAKFGVQKGPQLKPEQFEAFGAEIDALLAGESLS